MGASGAAFFWKSTNVSAQHIYNSNTVKKENDLKSFPSLSKQKLICSGFKLQYHVSANVALKRSWVFTSTCCTTMKYLPILDLPLLPTEPSWRPGEFTCDMCDGGREDGGIWEVRLRHHPCMQQPKATWLRT